MLKEKIKNVIIFPNLFEILSVFMIDCSLKKKGKGEGYDTTEY